MLGDRGKFRKPGENLLTYFSIYFLKRKNNNILCYTIYLYGL